jgi:hypothetical protein
VCANTRLRHDRGALKVPFGVIHLTAAITAYPIYPKSGHSANPGFMRGAAQGAQKRGEVRKDGQRGKAVPDENSIPRTTDIGLTRKQVHEARQKIPERW